MTKFHILGSLETEAEMRIQVHMIYWGWALWRSLLLLSFPTSSPSEAAGEGAEQGCDLSWSLASVRSHREPWNVNCTTELISPWSKSAVSYPHMNRSLAAGCQKRDHNLPGKAASGWGQFSREGDCSDPLTTNIHSRCRYGQDTNNIHCKIPYIWGNS